MKISEELGIELSDIQSLCSMMISTYMFGHQMKVITMPFYDGVDFRNFREYKYLLQQIDVGYTILFKVE